MELRRRSLERPERGSGLPDAGGPRRPRRHEPRDGQSRAAGGRTTRRHRPSPRKHRGGGCGAARSPRGVSSEPSTTSATPTSDKSFCAAWADVGGEVQSVAIMAGAARRARQSGRRAPRSLAVPRRAPVTLASAPSSAWPNSPAFLGSNRGVSLLRLACRRSISGVGARQGPATERGARRPLRVGRVPSWLARTVEVGRFEDRQLLRRAPLGLFEPERSQASCLGACETRSSS